MESKPSAPEMVHRIACLVLDGQEDQARELYRSLWSEFSLQEVVTSYDNLLATKRALFPLASRETTFQPLIPLAPNATMNFALPFTFVVNLPTRIDRKGMITRRLQRLNLPFTVIEAEYTTSPIVSYLSWNSGNLNAGTSYNRLAEFACYTSHLKAMRSFVDSHQPYGLIIEDDIAFRKGFIADYLAVLSQIQSQPLILLLVSNLNFYQRISPNNGVTLEPLDHECWGATAYLISREYALKVLAENDRPYYLCQKLPSYNRLTTEAFIMNSGGAAVSKPLVIEDITSSSINAGNPAHHLALFSPLGYENYDLS